MSATSWRQREIEKARLRKEAAARAEEEARTKSIQKTETNFPSMGRGGSQATPASFGTSFSSMAQQWATEEKIEKTIEEYRAQKVAKAARDNAVHGVVLFPTRRRPLSEVYEDDYEEEAPTRAPSEDDWTEVRNYKVKVKRELTTAELERKVREGSDEEYDDRDDEDHGTYGRPRSEW
jgi:hypothetical protein